MSERISLQVGFCLDPGLTVWVTRTMTSEITDELTDLASWLEVDLLLPQRALPIPSLRVEQCANTSCRPERHEPMKIERQTIVFDAADLAAESTFWAGLLGGTVEAYDDWHSISLDGTTRLAVQLAPDHVPPDWPDGRPQQIHLDLHIGDLQAAHEEAIARGAALLKPAEDPGASEGFQVYADPAGHPFCPVLGLTVQRKVTRCSPVNPPTDSRNRSAWPLCLAYSSTRWHRIHRMVGDRPSLQVRWADRSRPHHRAHRRPQLGIARQARSSGRLAPESGSGR